MAYEATAQAVGYSAELPKIAEAERRTEPPVFAPNETTRITLYSEGHEPSHPLTPDRW